MAVERTFSVASDDNLIELIRRARQRLVVICPAVTEAVAKAIADRLDEGLLTVTVILDADPEVYRLGYGTEAGLELVRAASKRSMLDLRVQPGIRIGVVISDDATMVFAPVPLLIEAGSTSVEKPNAIILSGTPVDRLAEAAGAGPADAAAPHEVGTAALTPAAADAVKQDLKANPPQSFDVARALRVFTSRVQYVEFGVENYRFSTLQVSLPAELLDIADDHLRKQISSRIRAPAEALGPFKIIIETGQDPVNIDEAWIHRERKRIEDGYTYIVPRYGRVIFSRDRQAFETEIVRFRLTLDTYCEAARTAFEAVKTDFQDRLVAEYLPRWKQNPPKNFIRHGIAITDDNLARELREVVQSTIGAAISFEAPQVRVIYKNIAQESVHEPRFREPLLKVMRRQGVPITLIESLFSAGDAAPAATGFDNV